MQQKLSEKTLEKARFLAEDGRVTRLSDGTWAVESSSVCVGAYIVSKTAYGYRCECKSYTYRQDCCHMRAVAIFEDDDPWSEFESEEVREEFCGICQLCGRDVPNGLGLCVGCGIQVGRSHLREAMLAS